MSQSKILSSGSDGDAIFRLPPFYYMHVLDLNSNVTRAVHRHQIADTVTRAPAAINRTVAGGCTA